MNESELKIITEECLNIVQLKKTLYHTINIVDKQNFSKSEKTTKAEEQ